MNVSTYIFGSFDNGYSQYPDDYTSSIFKKFYEKAKSVTQIAIHRDGNLIYYGYIRKLQEDKYIGLCVVLNSLALPSFYDLFSLFQHTISFLVDKGMLIRFDESGELTTCVDRLYLDNESIELVDNYLRKGFLRFKSYCVPLPPVSYATSKDSLKEFVVSDNSDDIFKSSYTNGYTYIYKSDNYNTNSMYSAKAVLKKEHDLRLDLEKQLQSLQNKYRKLEHVQKRTKVVAWLISVLLVIGAILAYVGYTASERGKIINHLNSELDTTRDSLNITVDNLVRTSEELDNIRYKLRVSEDSLSNCRGRISSLNSELSIVRDERNNLYDSNRKLREQIAGVRSDLASVRKEKEELSKSNQNLREQIGDNLIVSVPSVSPGYEKISFSCKSNKYFSSAKFTLKIIKNDESYKTEYTFYRTLYSGSNSLSYTYDYKLKNGYYHFLLYCNDKIVSYKRW